MAVAFDAKMTAGNSADGFNQRASVATSISSTGITVGASATCLVAMITFAEQAPAGPVGLAMTWDGVPMTAGPIASNTVGDRVGLSAIFWLDNPASGAKTLQATWSNSLDAYMSAVSFTGTATTNSVKAADNITATQTTTLTVTSSTDGATVVNFAVDGAAPTVNFTKIWADDPFSPGGGGNYTLGGTSNAHTFTGSGGTLQCIAGVHVVAPSGAAVVDHGEYLPPTGGGWDSTVTVW